ncbi:MAG: hypothetical protein WDM94_06590 [Bauldia sp.]
MPITKNDVAAAPAAKVRGKGKDSAVARLNKLVDEAELFLNQDRTPFASVNVNGHTQTHAVAGKSFREWLIFRYVQATRGAPPREKLKDAVARAEALALHSDKRLTTWLRVGWGDNGKHYLDLGDDNWRAVETDAAGWRVVDNPPIKFRRSGREQPLPEPISAFTELPDGGRLRNDSLIYLLSLVRVMTPGDRAQTKQAFRLLVGFVFDCLRPGGDHAILNLLGPPGASKTTAAETIIAIVDPREPATAGVPKTEDDLMVVASSRNVLAIDNASTLNQSLSDAFCRLTTGAGTEKRELYTSGEVFIIKACCPLIITSLEPPTARDDFQRRAINLHIKSTPAGQRLERQEVKELVRLMRPAFLGNLLEGVSCAIRRREETRKRLRGHLPALADLMTWVEAGALGLGLQDGEFQSAFKDHKQHAMIDAAQSDKLVQAIVEWLDDKPDRDFIGTPSAILDALKKRVTDSEMFDARQWLPVAARYLGDALESKQPLLVAAGVRHTSEVDKKTHNRVYRLKLGKGVVVPDALSVMELADADGGLGLMGKAAVVPDQLGATLANDAGLGLDSTE